MIYKKRPKNFKEKFTIVSCFVEYNTKILLLHRNKDKPQGNTWGVPAGKLFPQEDLKKGILRELMEETGISTQPEDLFYLEKVFVRYSDFDFIYHIFRLKVANILPVKINSREHQEYQWVRREEAMKMDLIQDLDKCIEIFYETHE